jgi:type II secretion system protein N
MATTDALDPNLLRSQRPAQKSEAEPATPANRRKRLLKIAAYAAFFVFSLVTFTVLKVPDAVIANSLLNALNQNTPFQWQAEKIGVSFFPAPHLKMEKLTLEPKVPGGVPLALDEVRVYPNPFALLPIGGAPAFGGYFRAEAYQAVVKGSFGAGRDLSLHLESDGVDLGKITPLAGLVDLKGKITALNFRIHLPNQRVGSADGEVRIKGKDMQLDPSSLGLPIVLPVLAVGDLDVQARITKGQVTIEKFSVGGPGKDLDLKIPSGTVNLSDITPNTRYDLHLLLKPSPAIEKAVPGFGTTLGMWSTLKPDGNYAMRVTGTFAAPGFPAKD